MQEIIQQGAEAIIYKIDNMIVKDRIAKKYRITGLDNKMRNRRTKKEAKLLYKASKIINSPKPLEITKLGNTINIPYIEGKKLSEQLDNLPNSKQICEQIGEQIAKLHNNNIIHGDLTTSNMILSEEKVFFIDFGLGYESNKLEDKAVDLHLIKQALEARHYENYKIFWKSIETGYKISTNALKVLSRLQIVESRGRYKKQY